MKNSDRILLLGNGVNRAVEGKNWRELLVSLDQGRSGIFTEENKDPFTVQYQQYLADRWNHGHDNDAMCRTHIAHSFKMMSRNMNDRSAHKAVLELGYRCILTTNYDHGLQKAWLEDSEGLPCPGPTERKFNLFRKYFLDGAELWHIHGDCMKPDTITIGFDHYIRQLSEIRGYFVGKSLSRKTPVKSVFHELPDTETLFKTGSSWIDRFMLLPIDIRGFGMNDAELDFWWLLFEKHKFSKRKNIPFDVKVFGVESEMQLPAFLRMERLGAQLVDCGDSYPSVYGLEPYTK